MTGPPLEAVETFLRQYYRFVAPADLEDRTPVELYGAALSHLELAAQRTAGTALVRVLSPTPDAEWHPP